MPEWFDVVVIGAGHAGCEAALGAARMGRSVLLTTLNLDSVALMPCNPAIGGTAKGHLVRELDAMGGEMGLSIDEVMIQSRMLNTAKGPAVHSLRAQADKKAYQKRMLRTILAQARLTLRQAEVAHIETQNGSVCAIVTATGTTINCRAVVVASGVYLDSAIIIGEYRRDSGPQGMMHCATLGRSLRDLGFPLRRFKTGTPARIDGRTIDFTRTEEQGGDMPIIPFSFLTDAPLENKVSCYLTYTNAQTHRIILENLHRAPMYAGGIHGTGARYCPSIEDKVVRFADKPRHPVFLEPEGLDTVEWYVQGVSTSMPEEIQHQIYASIPGLEHAKILRLAYAIEYDCIDPTQLTPALMAQHLPGLFFAGQINGTSGYEEAAAQGLMAGINAVLYVAEQPPFTLGRQDAYIGVLIDDLTGKGTDEPYRMMTSRAEYRLSLRQDNADLRLTERCAPFGLISEKRLSRTQEKRENTARIIELMQTLRTPNPDGGAGSISLSELAKRPNVNLSELIGAAPSLGDFPGDALQQAALCIRYEGYLLRQGAQIRQFVRAESMPIPPNIDYDDVHSLRIEARQKLAHIRPSSVGQASRIPGVSPGDLSVLMVYLHKSAVCVHESQSKTGGVDLC